jgi:hypothetical protein
MIDMIFTCDPKPRLVIIKKNAIENNGATVFIKLIPLDVSYKENRCLLLRIMVELQFKYYLQDRL